MCEYFENIQGLSIGTVYQMYRVQDTLSHTDSRCDAENHNSFLNKIKIDRVIDAIGQISGVSVITIGYRKLTPYFFVTCGEWMDAIESKRGTSLADRLSAAVIEFSEQNSVAKRNEANVSERR